MIELALRAESRLRLYYQSNLGDFSSPPRWRLSRWSVSFGDDPTALAGRLERAAEQREFDLEDLAAREGGRVEDLGWVEVGSLRQISPKLPALVAPLKVGELSPPYRVGDHLEMVELGGQRSAEPREFEEVRDRVAEAWVEQYRFEAYEELEHEILGDGSNLILDPEALTALRKSGRASRDVSVDELEKLFESL